MAGKSLAKRFRILRAWRRWERHSSLAMAMGTGVVIAILLTFQLLPDKVSLRIGQVAPRDVVAHRYVRYPNEAETERWRDLAARSVEPVYAKVADAAPQVEREVAAFFDRLQALRAERRAVPPAALLPDLRRIAPARLSENALHALAQMDERRLALARSAALQTAREVMASNAIRSDAGDLARAGGAAGSLLANSGLPDRESTAVASLVAQSLRPNRTLDERETEQKRLEERNSVQTVYHEVNRNELVIRKGERVTANHMEKFVRLGLQHPQVDLPTALSLALLAFGLVALFCFYVQQYHPRIFAERRLLVLISLICTGCLLLFRLAGGALDLRLSGEQTGYMGVMSASLAAMLVAALLNAQLGLFVGVCMALVTALLVDSQLKFAIIGLASSIVGVNGVVNIRDRAGILRTAVSVAAANVVAILITQGATAADLRSEIGPALAWGSVAGIGAVFLFVPAAALLERPFRLTTHLTLLELSDPNGPLLRRLSMEAPGTYAHSISVGNLGEGAAKLIGADSLFTRVASYYHDVGKIVRPHFFVENQVAHNQHAGMSASLSCLIVTAHVKDGVELAERYRLPPSVIDIIREHHGTCLIQYFYHQAVTSGGEDPAPALEYQFRYEGPRPRSKESGIIMLADAAEAASRTLEKPTPGRIRDLVERIVRDRLADGQLDDSELTFKDLERIIASFTRTLSSMLHARVEYPAGDTRELTRLAADAPAAKEPVAAGKPFADLPEPGPSAYPGPARA